MGSLFDELKKAKLIDKKKEKQLRHEQRVQKQDAKQRDDEEDAKRRAHEQRREQQRAQDRKKSEAEGQKKRDRARWAEFKQLVASRQLPRENGRRRWHFLASGGRLPFLEVSDATGKRLEAGELAIVRDPGREWPSYVIVPRDLGQRARELEPELVCWLR